MARSSGARAGAGVSDGRSAEHVGRMERPVHPASIARADFVGNLRSTAPRAAGSGGCGVGGRAGFELLYRAGSDDGAAGGDGNLLPGLEIRGVVPESSGGVELMR